MTAFLIVGFLAIQLDKELPNADEIKSIELKIPLRIYTSEGLLISEFGEERRKPLEVSNTPQVLVDAVLAAEDDSFFEHNGIDFKGLIRAALSNFSSSGGSKQGASTITMQVARNFYLTRDQTYSRKIKEIFLAIRLEQVLSKEEILSLYLNKIFLGHRAYGFAAAAEVYYGKPLNSLSTAQIAMLSGLPKAPSTFNPIRNADRALIRRNYVLGRLNELNFITEENYQAAISEPITAKKHQLKTDLSAPHIAEMVRAKLIEQFGSDVYWQGFDVTTTIKAKKQQAAQQALRKGLEAYDRRHGFRGPIDHIDIKQLITQSENDTTRLSIAYSELLANYANSNEHIPALITQTEIGSATAETKHFGSISIKLENASWAKRHRTQNIIGDKPTSLKKLFKPGDVVYVKALTSTDDPEKSTEWALSQIPDVGGALISIAPNSGQILALVGGYDFFLNKYNRATQSIRQPGSNIKPFIYSASLDKGFTPATLISGAPIVMRDPTHGTLWRPQDYSGKFFGPTRMRTALTKSMNLISIRLLRSIGIPYAREFISRFGIDMNRFSASLTMALGSGGVTPIDMLGAYGVLANGGYRVEPYFIETISDRNGNIVYQAPKATLCDECYQDYLISESEQAKNSNETRETTHKIEPKLFNQNGDIPDSYNAPRVMSPENNFLIVDMLKSVIKSGTGRKALALNRSDLAGKTGTTNDYVDAWFSGFNSKIATTVWVGFDKPKSMGRGEAGGVAALPIWVDYMSTALKGISEDQHRVPDYIQEAHINRSTGQQTTEDDPQAIIEYFAHSLNDNNTIEAISDINLSNTLESAAPGNTSINDNNYFDDNLYEQQNPLNPARIIDNPEDTQGLF